MKPRGRSIFQDVIDRILEIEKKERIKLVTIEKGSALGASLKSLLTCYRCKAELTTEDILFKSAACAPTGIYLCKKCLS